MSVAVSVRTLITETFRDLGVTSVGEVLTPEMADDGLSKLTRLFDDWNAEMAAVYANRLITYTLVPSLQPHTIGPTASSPTFTVTSRPVSIDGANLVLNDVSPAVHRPINIRDAEWWRLLVIPTLSTSIPTDLYYNAEWPLGELFLWPVPTTAYGLELQYRIVLDEVDLDDTLTLPPGYRNAITLTLGEYLAPSYSPAEPQPLAAARARARVWANNDVTPRLITADAGMPRSGDDKRTTFNYRTGMYS